MRNLIYRSSAKILVILFTVMIVITGCQQCPKFSDKTKDIDSMLREKRSEIDYKDYVSIKMEPSEILFNKTTEKQVVDNEYCSIVYKVKVENIRNENIKINLKVLIPDELTSTIIYGDHSLGPRNKYIKLKPGEKIDIGFGTIMKHLDRLSKSQKELFENYKNILYIELLINGKKVYYKINALKEHSCNK